jgi:hypothetical protein
MEEKINDIAIIETDLLNEISQLVEQTQQQVIVQNNSSLTLLFWEVGFRINETILHNKRSEYGKQIVPTLSVQLENKYGRNFEEKNLRRMMQFADKEIVVTLSRQLSWSHFLAIIPIENLEAKLFYANQVGDQLMSVPDVFAIITIYNNY